MSVVQAIWKMVRPLNLLIIAVTITMMSITLATIGITSSDSTKLWIYSACLLLIAAGGNVLNDLVDVTTDHFNPRKRNPVNREIPMGFAWFLYGAFTFIGLMIGWIFFEEWNLSYQLLGITAIGLLLYSLILQKLPLIGNIMVSALCTTPVLLVAYEHNVQLEVLDHQYTEALPEFSMETNIILLFMGLAFFQNLLRELIKDLEDMEADKKAGYWTIPVLSGFDSSKSGVIWQAMGTMIIELTLVYFMWNSEGIWQEFSLMFFALAPLPMIPIIISLMKMKEPLDASTPSILLKLSMFLGISTTVFFWFI